MILSSYMVVSRHFDKINPIDMRILLTSILTVILFNCVGQTANYKGVKDLYDQGKSFEAINLASSELKKINSSDSLYKKLIRIRVVCYMNESDFKSAIADYETLIRLTPENIDNYSGLSYAYWALGDNENCLKASNKAYEINPKDPLTLSNLSYYSGQLGKVDECIYFSNKGLAINNLDSVVKGLLLNNRAYGYLMQQKFDKASIDINESISLNSNNSYAYCYRALANIGLKQMDTVCQDLTTSKELGGETLTKDLIEKYCKK